jgi:hypothetical protein
MGVCTGPDFQKTKKQQKDLFLLKQRLWIKQIIILTVEKA